MLARFLRSSYRIPGFLLLCFYHWVLLVWVRQRNNQDPYAIHQVFLTFIHRVHRLMGIRITTTGVLEDKPSILMGNHRSYVDAILIPAKYPVGFVARSESKNWPFIGWGAMALNTIWVNRKSKDSRRATREEVKRRLNAGFGIIIFPEGTTCRGPELLEYRPSMFYISAEGGFPITPIAIEYRDPEIAWVNREWFVPHAWKHFGKKHIDVHVSIGPTQTGEEGQALLDQTRNWTQKEVQRLRVAWDAEIGRVD